MSITITPSAGGGGGGGGGTVTSITALSSSLDFSLSVPNPILGAGTVQFEVQIIDKTKAAALADEIANTLLPGVIYRITDFNKVLKVQTLTHAEFICIKNAAGLKVLSTNGNAFDAVGNQFNVSYNLKLDALTEVYFAPMNQRAADHIGSFSTCVTQFRFNDIKWFNSQMANCFISSTGAGTICKNTVIGAGVTITWTFAGNGFVDCEIYGNVQFQLGSPFLLTSSYLAPGSQLSIDDNGTAVFLAANSSFTINNGFPVTGRYVGAGCIAFSSGNFPVNNNVASDWNQNERVQLFTAVANPEQIASSQATNIFVNIDATAIPVGYQINMPQFPTDKQTVNIGWDGAYATALGLVTATFAAGGIFIPLQASQKGQSSRWIYDAPTLTWFLS